MRVRRKVRLPMKTNERFLAALKTMNTTMKEDVKAGRKWRYSNSSAKQAHTFDLARKKGLRYTNCVLAVWWGLRIAGLPDSALHWMGVEGKISWTKSGAKAAAEKYFRIIETGGKTVQQLWDRKLLCDGDVLLGFQSMHHTCVYYGGTGKNAGRKSFDAGHSYTTGGSGEGALFKKWIGDLTCKNYKVNYILRLKDRAHWRVQAGAFYDPKMYAQREALLISKGYKPEMKFEDGMYKAQLALCDGVSNARRIAAELAGKNIGAFVVQVD